MYAPGLLARQKGTPCNHVLPGSSVQYGTYGMEAGTSKYRECKCVITQWRRLIFFDHVLFHFSYSLFYNNDNYDII
jgi:hypothetical protein